MLECQLFLPGLRGDPWVFLIHQAPASPAVLGPSYVPFQMALSVNMTRAEPRGALSSFAQWVLAAMPQLTSSSNHLGGTDRKILTSFSFPANCSHLLPQFWLDSPFPLSSASTTRLSPPHPSPPLPKDKQSYYNNELARLLTAASGEGNYPTPRPQPPLSSLIKRGFWGRFVLWLEMKRLLIREPLLGSGWQEQWWNGRSTRPFRGGGRREKCELLCNVVHPPLTP